jgi:hypothetical protein
MASSSFRRMTNTPNAEVLQVSAAGGKKSKDFFVIAGRGALRPDFPSPNPG